MTDDVVVHLSPVLHDRANFLIFAAIEGEKPLPRNWEQLWARQHSARIFEICCLPFFIYGVSLGDYVETTSKEGRQFVVSSVVKKSGHRTFRIWFGDSSTKDVKEDVLIKVKDELNCLVEWYSGNLLAIDSPSERTVKIITNYLEKKSKSDHLAYELT